MGIYCGVVPHDRIFSLKNRAFGARVMTQQVKWRVVHTSSTSAPVET